MQGRRRSRLGALIGSLLAGALLVGCTQSGYRWVQPHKAAGTPGGYVVRPGDTLYAISFRHDLDYHQVARWNHIRPPYTIYPGERLRLTPPAGHAAKLAPHPAAHPLPTVAAVRPPKPALTWQWPARGRLLTIPDSPVAPKGINISGHVGEPVHAAAAGRVVYSGDGLKGYGRLIIIKHSAHYLSAYGDNSKLEVREGDRVRQGQIIARMGLGPGNKPMVHFEIRRDGKPVDPLHFLPSID